MLFINIPFPGLLEKAYLKLSTQCATQGTYDSKFRSLVHIAQKLTYLHGLVDNLLFLMDIVELRLVKLRWCTPYWSMHVRCAPALWCQLACTQKNNGCCLWSFVACLHLFQVFSVCFFSHIMHNRLQTRRIEQAKWLGTTTCYRKQSFPCD